MNHYSKKRGINCLGVLLCCIVLISTNSCSNSSKTIDSGSNSSQTITYKESFEDFPNPERGFYRYTQTLASDFSALSLNQLKEWRSLQPVSNGNYKIYSTLIFRYYVLDIFKNAPLSTSFLNALKVDCEIARIAGVKLIPRFAYTLTAKEGDCPEGFICPPYGDAPKEIVLQHIGQLKTFFVENADVIAAVQMGFIGVWGEQYYTDYFGDASMNDSPQKLLDQHWKDRIEVAKALLQAVPVNRMIQVRYPQLKQRIVYGIEASTGVAPLTLEEAFNDQDKARIGYHNDCFLASADDYGTYMDYGNSSTPRQAATVELRNYKHNDSKFVVVGGETCDDAFSPQNDCEPAGKAKTEMALFHYSYLNSAYNNEVNNDWQSGGCMEEIKLKLGYRLVLKNSLFPREIMRTEPLSIRIQLENVGYASPYNPRPVKLVLRNTGNGSQYFIDIPEDPRRWFPGNVSIENELPLPSNIAAGTYDTFLFLPDSSSKIADRQEYAIRFANENTWESSTGLNRLNAKVVIR